jgi:hypothetical protein
MFDANINVSVVAATGVGNEVLVKPREGRKLSFSGRSKQEKLKKELKQNYERYESVLTENSWTLLLYLHKKNSPSSIKDLAVLIEPDVKDDDRFLSEFRYRLEWLVQLGLLDRPSRNSNAYELSIVGESLIGIAQVKDGTAGLSESCFNRAAHKLKSAWKATEHKPQLQEIIDQ